MKRGNTAIVAIMILSAMLCSAPLSAETLYFDFGKSDIPTAGAWNNITAPSAGTEQHDLVNSEGKVTTLSYACSESFVGVADTETSRVSPYPQSAVADFFYIVGTCQIQIKGLSLSGCYAFTFYTTRFSAATPFHLDIASDGQQVAMRDAPDGQSASATITQIMPDSDGVVTINFSTPPGSYAYLGVVVFETCTLAPVQLVLSEFMASNTLTLKDPLGNRPDWIEVTNVGEYTANIAGWSLTDDPDKRDKWVFPSYRILPRESLVVYASGKDRRLATEPLHTNFKLSADGEYLAMVAPDGTVVTEHDPAYPHQITDISYGLMSGNELTQTLLVDADAQVDVLIPTNDMLDDGSWTWPGFDTGVWRQGDLGVGYDTGNSYDLYIRTDVIEMRTVTQSPSVYLRILFEVDNPSAYESLLLRMKYDDGFVAYINGVDVARSATVTSTQQYLPWNYFSQNHPDNEAMVFEDIPIAVTPGLLRMGTNVLAVHGFNDDATSTSSDLLFLPELLAMSTSAAAEEPAGYWGYMTTPTPGQPNVGGTQTLGPLIAPATNIYPSPADTEDLIISDQVTETLSPVQSVTLVYRVMYGGEVSLAMVDDGSGADNVAGDGLYTALIPHTAAGPGEMVRWRLVAEDTDGVRFQQPTFFDPLKSPEYYGTVIADPQIESDLPVYHWFTTNYEGARGSGARASVFYAGRFYDNVFVRRRAKSSGISNAGKPCLKFDFNPGHGFFYSAEMPSVGEINLNNNKYDKSLIAQILGMRAFAQAGAPYSICSAFHVRLNGEFFAIQIFVEQPDEDYLRRNGLDANGALYKELQSPWNDLIQGAMVNGLGKHTRLFEDYADVIAFADGVRAFYGTPSSSDGREHDFSSPKPHTERLRFCYDNVDIAQVVNYTAAMSIIHGNDHNGKNAYLYRDTEGTGLWFFLPWDLDLSHGHNFASLNNKMYADELPGGHPLWACSDYPRGNMGSSHWNGLIDIVMDTPELRQMHLRRLRSLMDAILQPPGLPYGDYHYEAFMDSFEQRIASTVPLEIARWPGDYSYNGTYYPADQLERIKSLFLEPRRVHLFITHNIDRFTGEANLDFCAGIPHTQTAGLVIDFGAIEVDPASGNQDQEYIELVNSNDEAVDISNWSLTGAVEQRFTPGTVIPAGHSLYVSPSVKDFLARTTAPTGGQNRFVQGNYQGHLSRQGEVLELRDATGALINTIHTPRQ